MLSKSEMLSFTGRKPTIPEIFRDNLYQYIDRGYTAFSGVSVDDFEVEYQSEPHFPHPLPEGKQAIYLFFHEKTCLYVGLAGVKSSSRFYSQHYNVRGKHSILAHKLVRDGYSTSAAVKGWMKGNCWRVNIYADGVISRKVMEALRDHFKHVYKPAYGI